MDESIEMLRTTTVTNFVNETRNVSHIMLKTCAWNYCFYLVIYM